MQAKQQWVLLPAVAFHQRQAAHNAAIIPVAWHATGMITA
jgi:hypothetical protein